MDSWLHLQNKIVPDITEVLVKRYNILRTILHFEPLGRRLLSQKMKETERSIRKDLDFLRQQGLLQVTGGGTTITPAGRRLVEELDGIVQIMQGIELQEKILRDHFGLEHVIVVPGHGNPLSGKKELGRFTLRYLLDTIEEGQILAVTGGTTLANVGAAAHGNPRSPKNLTVVSARGGLGERVEIEANTIAVNIARAMGGKYSLLYLPDYLEPETLASLKKERSILEVLNVLKDTDILLHGIGDAGEMAARRQLPAEKIAAIIAAGAVGEAFGYYFNSKGEVVYTTPSVGINWEDLPKIRKVIAVAGGADKAAAIMAVVNAKNQNVLITDEAAAEVIIKKVKEGIA